MREPLGSQRVMREPRRGAESHESHWGATREPGSHKKVLLVIRIHMDTISIYQPLIVVYTEI